MADYEAGLCNIGPKGRMQRLVFGILAIAFSVGLWGLIRLNTVPSVYVILLFFPLLAGFVGIFESVFGFCAVFGIRGSYDLR